MIECRYMKVAYKKVFSSEKVMNDYLESNLEEFCREIIGEELISFKRESYISEVRAFGANLPRIDFDVTTKTKRVLIECKNPSQRFAEMSRAVSQLLTYATIAREECELIIVTSGTVGIVQEMIAKYELPVKVVYMTRDVLAEWTTTFYEELESGIIQVENQYAIPQ